MGELDSDKTPSDDELQALVIDTYGWQFDGPFYTEVPQPRPEYIQGVRDDAERLRHHLLATYVIRDQFDRDHGARRAFLREQDLSAFVKRKNKLKGNNLFGAVISMDMIMIKLERKFPAIHQALRAIFTPDIYEPVNSLVYNAMTFEQKVAFARKLDDAIYRFLGVLAR